MIETAMKIKPVKSAKTKSATEGLLKNIVNGKRLLKFRNGTKIFSQGEGGNAVFFLKTGKVELTVVSPQGKEAVLARLGPRDFMGEECLVDSSHRTSTATSVGLSTIFRIMKREMLNALHADPRLSREFTSALLARSINLEEDLSDELFNHSEKRLACAILKLTRQGSRKKLEDAKIQKITQSTLAELVGTTPSKIGEFMKKFRKLGLIDYKGAGDITVKTELLTEAVLHG